MLEQIMDDEDELRELNLSSRPRREERRKQRERDRMERQLTRCAVLLLCAYIFDPAALCLVYAPAHQVGGAVESCAVCCVSFGFMLCHMCLPYAWDSEWSASSAGGLLCVICACCHVPEQQLTRWSACCRGCVTCIAAVYMLACACCHMPGSCAPLG
jgi:hypothetical protein